MPTLPTASRVAVLRRERAERPVKTASEGAWDSERGKGIGDIVRTERVDRYNDEDLEKKKGRSNSGD